MPGNSLRTPGQDSRHATVKILNTKLHVANLAPTATEKHLQVLFSAHGNVADVNLPVEHESGRSRGFAIVTMATPQGARAAMLALNGKKVEAQVLTVTEYVSVRKVPPATGSASAKCNVQRFERG